MIIKGLIDEDIINYKEISMVIEFPYCNFKCDKECGIAVCQNSNLTKEPNIDIDYPTLIERYKNNYITKAIVMQGLEPLDSFSDIMNFLLFLRRIYGCKDDVVIYTGYTETEVEPLIKYLQEYENIIIKFGRYIPNQEPHLDPVLGVNLASDNQYAKKIC